MDIGRNIRKMRTILDINQRELAERVGLSTQAISQYETNRREPRIDTLKDIAEALMVSVDELLKGEEGRMNDLKRYVFTFGMGHELTHRYLVIWATDFASARTIMFEHHGRNWAFQYTWDEWAKGVAEAQSRGQTLEYPLNHEIIQKF